MEIKFVDFYKIIEIDGIVYKIIPTANYLRTTNINQPNFGCFIKDILINDEIINIPTHIKLSNDLISSYNETYLPVRGIVNNINVNKNIKYFNVIKTDNDKLLQEIISYNGIVYLINNISLPTTENENLLFIMLIPPNLNIKTYKIPNSIKEIYIDEFNLNSHIKNIYSSNNSLKIYAKRDCDTFQYVKNIILKNMIIKIKNNLSYKIV